MKKTDEPGWPATGGFPFMPFPLPGVSTAAPAPAPNAAAPSLLEGVSGGIDLLNDFWKKLPGATPLPGFMVPTVNVEELDKRIADLRAAEKWVEVNLNLLRTTIQGLEVQRHTIAAIHSLSTMAERPERAPDQDGPGAPAAPGAGDWLAYLQDQFVKVAGAAIGESAAPVAPKGRKRAPARKKKSATTSRREKAGSSRG